MRAAYYTSALPTGSTPLTGAGQNVAICCGYYPHSGAHFVLMNNIGVTGTETLSQQITLCGGTNKATLNFWLWTSCAETTTTAKNDTLTLTVTPTGGTAATIASFSNLNKGSGHVLYSYDLSTYLGQTVTLKFTGTENRSRATAFLLDDISAVVQ